MFIRKLTGKTTNVAETFLLTKNRIIFIILLFCQYDTSLIKKIHWEIDTGQCHFWRDESSWTERKKLMEENIFFNLLNMYFFMNFATNDAKFYLLCDSVQNLYSFLNKILKKIVKTKKGSQELYLNRTKNLCSSFHSII